MADWHKPEKEKYNRAYESGKYSPKEGRLLWNGFLTKEQFLLGKRILDVGCSDGYAILKCRDKGIEAWGVDISDSLIRKWDEWGIGDYCKSCPADQLPFDSNYFDFITCLDIMEHIPEEGIMPTLNEIYRVGNNEFLFVICVTAAVNKFLDGSEPHVCVKSKEWWDERIEEVGFKIYKSSPSRDESHIFVIANK